MVDAVSREMILPALRLDVPSRPSEQQVLAFLERTSEQWSQGPREWLTHQVTRLAVAAVLRSRLDQAASLPTERHPLPGDPEQVTLGQLVAAFRPHVGLSTQAFQLGLVEAVNAHVPAAVDPLREGLRRLGVTGRDPLKVIALGLDKVPARAAGDFFQGVRSAPALTALVDALAGAASSDLSGLDRSQLARADAIVLGGGKATAITIGASTRKREAAKGRPWLTVPLAVGRPARGDARGTGGSGAAGGVEVALKSSGWAEVFETALDAVGSAMAQIDSGGKPRLGSRSGRSDPLSDVMAQRLVAAKDRTVAEVCASLRDLDPLVLEMFDHQVVVTPVRVPVPVVEDDAFLQLWLPSSALAGPLFTGSPDLFLGEGSDVRTVGGKPQGGRAPQGGRPPQGERAKKPRQPQAQDGGARPAGEGRRNNRRGKGRGPRPDAAPSATPDAAPAPAPVAEQAAAPDAPFEV
ncbi:hypothetical protein [Nocardioides sp.]|uniref:hypothetical protein n=1 Tax=Nocardioides sp. TaxID=35761 RepID=UPI002B27A355|nr:hypothetical protein [Nocardioides sp.]